ncbi:polysaccharide deacetylase family protein [Ligilactobacillus sp. WILCCON 0076]|uniref:Polysaccharide deacetylase family protein n=1 Tax=Ligilactobacillus ubinensis TaxID=2876789 RepID=A0A9X2FKG6_9LACO|nr:polysaccharide deacetylase family protein [Ligilactobacillus ubinensis]MCP0887276.1 polysaccharide deacetylase family protein [Ligilactobacillus ubinensis]
MSKKKSTILGLLGILLVIIVAIACTKYSQHQKQLQEQKISAMKKQSSKKVVAAAKASSIAKQKKENAKWKKYSTKISFPILMYHSISNVSGNSLCVSPEKFKQEMQWLKKHGYYTLTAAEAYRVLTTNEKPAKKIVWVTLDDGYEDNYTAAYPILKKYKIKATINLITGQIQNKQANKLTVAQLKEMKKSGLVSYGSHTVNHLDLSELTATEQNYQIKNSKSWLDKTLDQNTKYLCYPSGKYNSLTLTEAKKAGYTIATSTEEGLASSSNGLLELHRVRVSPNLSDTGFQNLLEYGE